MDETETIRRLLVREVNSQVESDDEVTERARLEKKYGKVWNTKELTHDFHVKGFAAPFVVVEELSTGRKGLLMFQHWPRFYFDWQPEKETENGPG